MQGTRLENGSNQKKGAAGYKGREPPGSEHSRTQGLQRRRRVTEEVPHTMPAPLLLLRTVLLRALSSRTVVSGARQLRRGAHWAGGRLSLLLRRLWRYLTSDQFREAVLSCVLYLLSLARKETTTSRP
ncbi:protein myomixer [Dendrobates tinctorius]|uniref:protein myomixer n=1 Tax=Dendrobates tinctorius TaxID=92724 RepID=UPI003CCA6553